jgi:hypothetical protein
MMGGAIILAIATSVFNSYTNPRLGAVAGLPDDSSLVSLSQYLAEAPVNVKEDIQVTLTKGYNWQMVVLCVVGALQIPLTLLMWQKKLIRVG